MAARHHMVHPGPVHPRRVEWARSRLIEVSATTGTAGASLEQAIASAVAATGATSGNGTLRSLKLSKTRFTTGGPARDGKAANYTFIRDWQAHALSVGTFTFGLDQEGQPFVHCHAVIDDPESDAPIAGHLFPKDCVVAAPFDVSLVGLPDITLIQRPDPETLHSVFDIGDSRSAQGNSLFIRVRPNEDVTRAVERACAEAGIIDATIVASVGSLNAPQLDTGSHESVGMEVIAFNGQVRAGVATLQAQLCNEDGTLFDGQLIADGASVCVTTELIVSRAD
ncbi:MAG: DUF296 domain-containing protein [Ahrensia sp.]